ncbi:SMI1/KNR4 family protein [Streptomyces albidoflavus]|uniref:SMI1/KNR4 family protein n=1 Tax=Streptomyces albidoflavus TaxID=1886 RepID=UPI0033C1650C
MTDGTSHPLALETLATWEPVLRLLRDGSPSARRSGHVARHSWSLGLRRPPLPRPGRAARSAGIRAEAEAVEPVRGALVEAGIDGVSFVADLAENGSAVLHLLWPGPGVEYGVRGAYPGALVLVEGALPEPWRRLPDPAPGAVVAPSASPAELARMLRERVPGAGAGTTEAEVAAAGARLGRALPGELAVLYRVIGAARGGDAARRVAERAAPVLGCELLPLDGMYVADAAAREAGWEWGATAAVVTGPDARVQGLAGSPGWLVFGEADGDRLAVDLTPGPRGHLGQVVRLDHEQVVGAELVADSLTDLVAGRHREERRTRRGELSPVVARVDAKGLPHVDAAADPALEVLTIGLRDGAPMSLAALVGLPRLRTLTAYPGTLADPLEAGRLTGLEFLRLGVAEWRALLDAGAVPPTLAAAAVETHGAPDPLAVAALADELLALRGRPPVRRTVIEG